MARQPIRIIGIDPGLRRTGWGVIAVDGNRLAYLADGHASSEDSDSLPARLIELQAQLAVVIARWAPEEAAVVAVEMARIAQRYAPG